MENELLLNKHLLLCLNRNLDEELKDRFCGVVFEDKDSYQTYKKTPNTRLYIAGDIGKDFGDLDLVNIDKVFVVTDFSSNFDSTGFNLVTSGQVPLNYNGVGLFYKDFFDSSIDYFKTLTEKHEFQSLTESNKEGEAYRKGIYLSKVYKDKDDIRFNLLRCSTNLKGPTDNFRKIDHDIVSKVNENVQPFFERKVELNHVLAQAYFNKVVTNDITGTDKEKKAKIKEHSDKTKDMPKTGLIAFCSFYKDYQYNKFNSDLDIKRSKKDPYDFVYKDGSALTRLRFRLKKEVEDENLVKNFDVVLYPNSLFVISLMTNRLYTHEIVPSNLSISQIPTRMGYVIRCSETEAVFRDNKTFILNKGELEKLEQPTKEGVDKLKNMYFRENSTTEKVFYNGFNFSLNSGDYLEPNL